MGGKLGGSSCSQELLWGAGAPQDRQGLLNRHRFQGGTAQAEAAPGSQESGVDPSWSTVSGKGKHRQKLVWKPGCREV